MSYMHINNLYKDQDILMFKECYAMEKIHGSSAHINWRTSAMVSDLPDGDRPQGNVNLFCGGCKRKLFNSLFDIEELADKFIETGLDSVTIYGEGYGGKMQGMSATYGKELKFVAFEVKIGDCWLSVPDADGFCTALGIEFVAYEKVSTDIEVLDKERDKFSRQAKRNGIEEDKISEGVVLRPLVELKKNNGARIMCKHKRDEFMETQKPRKVQDPAKLKILEDAKAVAEEWVTLMRLNHVLDKVKSELTKDIGMESMKFIITYMIADVKREGEGEIVWSKAVEKYIGQTTAKMTKQFFQNKLKEKIK